MSKRKLKPKKMTVDELVEGMAPLTKKTAQGYLYAKVDEFVTVTDIKGKNYPSYKHMEQEFKDWLWGTKKDPKP